ncbi:MAG TPA: hypothetical protein VIM73_10040, partial [Polyangiaceae bacterium]
MNGARLSASCAVLLLSVLGPCAPRPAAARAPELLLEASSLLGSTTPERGGWRSVLVRVHNPGGSPVTGTIEVDTRVPWVQSSKSLSTKLPFSLAPGASSRLEAPTRSFGDAESAIRVRARDSEGKLLAETGLTKQHPSDALVLHLETPSRIAPVLRGVSFTSRRGPVYGGRTRTCAIGVSSAPVEAASGDPLLPERAAGYSEATLVLGSARALSKLSEPERAALAAWVLSGGALAVTLTRPEDLEEPLLSALVGGKLSPEAAPRALGEPTLFVVPTDEVEQQNPAAPAPLRGMRLAPSAHTRSKLVSYSASNARPTEWGAAASYGLGEVHLLAFDPDDPAVASDPWTRYKLADLVRHAFDREPLAVLRQSAQSPDALLVDGVRRELDPNQATRWTIVVSAVVLLLYAGLAGPLSFYLAARRGKPLRALLQLPLWSAVALGIVAVLGLFGKGIAGKARRLAIVEAGAGTTTGAALFFRGFYAASSRDLVVRAARRENVLDLAGLGDDLPRTLAVDRDGPRLLGLRTRPWQTLLVREEGFFDLSGGISVVPSGGDVLIHNRSARDLIGVVVKPAAADARYIARIRDGESVLASKGRPISLLGAVMKGFSPTSPLSADSFANTVDADFPGLGKVWRAVEPAVSGGGEWWPTDVPVLIGAL